ncbi:Gfo/Idh/MocA family oxidoreductase [Halosimplex litoreum]|uniref:Gfo/Idh/MocA family oxidoreductase n=1 Tax=Halosimplex litoreum TaxID=1198301 RepID=A0A7U3WBI0_9EURY|nr:Gfo/Idh/MocA family oxidoreductase [Halosimplex litoreum]QPV64975.1 Gfo/Idh/MocA family oxidoreductase [Halosimplex litoreum]
MTETLRYGIVGCAGIGNTHAEAVAAVDGVELVACADLDADAAETFADDHGVAETFADPAAMVAEGAVDAASVCTPSGTHADVTTDLAAAGANVLCEKPLDVTAERVDRMVEACEEAGVTLAGVFQRRFDPAVRRAKQAVEEGEIGQPVLADTHLKWFRPQAYYDSAGWRGTREMDGGAFMNQGIHSLDALQWVMGGVESVQAEADALARELECEDTGAMVLRFENGAVGTVAVTMATKGGTDRTEINGTEGSLALGDDGIEVRVGTGEETLWSAETQSRAPAVERAAHPAGDGHEGVVRDFVNAVRDGRDPEAPAREARAAVDIVLAAYRSAETGERIALDEVRAD